MINSLVQVENVASYDFMRPGMESGKILLHAIWYDVEKHSVMVFSRSEKRFIPVEDASTIDLIVKEARETVSKVKASKVAFEKESVYAAIEATIQQSSQCNVKCNHTL